MDPNKVSYSRLAYEFDCVLEDVVIPTQNELNNFYLRHQNASWFYGIKHPLDMCYTQLCMLSTELCALRRTALGAAAFPGTATYHQHLVPVPDHVQCSVEDCELAALKESTCKNLVKQVAQVQSNLDIAVRWLRSKWGTDVGQLFIISTNFRKASWLKSSFSVSMQPVPSENLPKEPPQHTELSQLAGTSTKETSCSSVTKKTQVAAADENKSPIITIDSDDTSCADTNIRQSQIAQLQENDKCVFCDYNLTTEDKDWDPAWRRAKMLGHLLQQHPAQFADAVLKVKMRDG